MLRIVALAGALALALALPLGAAAQSPEAAAPATGMGKGMGHGKGHGHDPACRAAMRELCPDAEPGTEAFRTCVFGKAEELPDECRGGRGHAEGLKAIRKACQDDIAAHCAGVKEEGGRVGMCLQEHRSELSDDCGDFIDFVQARRQQGRQGSPPGESPPPAPQPEKQGDPAPER